MQFFSTRLFFTQFLWNLFVYIAGTNARIAHSRHALLPLMCFHQKMNDWNVECIHRYISMSKTDFHHKIMPILLYPNRAKEWERDKKKKKQLANRNRLQIPIKWQWSANGRELIVLQYDSCVCFWGKFTAHAHCVYRHIQFNLIYLWFAKCAQ